MGSTEIPAFNYADPAVTADPFPSFARLREHDPVHWSGAMKAWVITRHDDVKRVALNNRELSADRLQPFFRANPDFEQRGFTSLLRYLGQWMVFRDPPVHTRLRRLFTGAFTPSTVSGMRTNIEEIVALLLDAMEMKRKSGDTVDFIMDFAYPLPAMVMMDLLGVPRTDLAQVKVWSDRIALFIGTAQASADKYALAEEGARAMAAYFRDLIGQRRASPGPDIISDLIAAGTEGDRLSDDEIIGTCILLLFAGHETTANMLGNGFYHSMRQRDQWERLVADPALSETATEEWLRYDGPSGAVARVVAQDHEFGGRALKAGQRVFAFLNAANRDGRVFADPDRLDVGRADNPHITFGHGIHFCLGAPLARLEGRLAIAALAQRMPRIRLSEQGPQPAWNDSLILRGLHHLPVTF